MKETILLTGGTGFLGTEITRRLARDNQKEIYILTRADSAEDAAGRLKAAWHHDKQLTGKIGSQIIAVPGDFTKAGLALSEDDRGILRERVSLIYHCGAEIGFQKGERELMTTNARGTENMISFAKDLPHLCRFVHISTAYVAGQKTGLITEDDLPGNEFSSLYEKSKALAELLVRSSGLPFVICRPGMIVGDSETGRIKNFNTIYYVLKLMLLGRLRVLPIRQDSGLNLVPVDYVADAAVKIGASEEAEGKTFHLTCPALMQPRAAELADYVRAWAREHLGADLPRPVFLPMHALKGVGLTHNRKKEDRKKTPLSNLMTLLPYFFSDQEFDRSNTDRIAGEFELNWRDYIDPLLDFACRRNFMRQTGATVFEQARTRRESKRYPICYYDVAADGITACKGPEANERIERIRNALWAWGIRKGDRVALTGINSVDYMTLEQAIGLLGAVSVPIYYTTPAEEITELISRSGSTWFFVGDTRIMKEIDKVRTGARIVSFSVARQMDGPAVMRWKTFLARASEGERAPDQHPDPDDLVTIRYTSGTTGDPKGVMFSFAQLAWMGEVLTNLLPWEERNRSMRYLSFLPQSHVVEGILASYAPYYMLAKADFYYLNDFGALTQALPKVRPSVFFSVPRFYEKVWDQVMVSGAGRRWASMAEGPAKRALAALVRRATLKKAGLDACSQLIVGSAPVSEELLLNYRKLGIEIYNAYGQTEAPLITINRLGDNVIPTIGTPLPETEVTAADDGELLVKGPQVTTGYYGLSTDTVRDGILKTGDLGTIHENGHISLHGRKKEMIITAYGKNISLPKIEERLKNIPGVSEAVLIGENRPYCTALLWLDQEEGADAPATEEGAGKKGRSERRQRIEEEIHHVNQDLSHPEQVRDFRIIDRPLSIRAGELTPNLKVKRANVHQRFANEIEDMYR